MQGLKKTKFLDIFQFRLAKYRDQLNNTLEEFPGYDKRRLKKMDLQLL